MFFFLLIGPVNFTDFVKIMSETLAESNDWGSLKTDVEGYVGIDSIQDQIRKKALKRGFEFNIMVVGEYFLREMTPSGRSFYLKVIATIPPSLPVPLSQE